MKPDFSGAEWSKVGGKFNDERNSTHLWMRVGAQVSCVPSFGVSCVLRNFFSLACRDSGAKARLREDQDAQGGRLSLHGRASGVPRKI
jgi:hypothetical protein